MKLRSIPMIAGLSGLLVLAAGIAVSQERKPVPPPQPHLFHLWTDAQGDTHLEEIKLANNRRPMVPGVTINFSGLPGRGGPPLLHNAPARQFAITVSGAIDVEASDGTKAHLATGDMAFLEDTTGKGHKTIEEGASSVFLRVPADFDIKAWARGE
jgi:hypothetical protein